MILQLPISSDLLQTFTCTLGNAGTFNFRVYWNERAQVWQMDIANSVSSAVVINGLRLVRSCDLLLPYGLHESFGTLVVIDGLATGKDPSADWLAQGFYVVWLAPSELTS